MPKRALYGLLLSAFAMGCFAHEKAGDSSAAIGDWRRAADEVDSTATATELTPEQRAARLEQLATIFGVRSLLDRIAEAPAGSSSDAQLVRIRLREDALSNLDRIALTIATTVARIEREEFKTVNASSTLDARHNRSVQTWSLAAILTGTTTSITGTAIDLGPTPTYSRIGNGIIIGGAAVAACFTVVALTRKNRSRPPFAIETNFLAQLFGRTPTRGSTLPEPVWSYLDTVLAGERVSIRDHLLEAWVKQGSVSFAPSATARHTLDLLTSPISAQQSIDASVLTSRANMLADLRATISEMAVDLQTLARHVKEQTE